MHCVIIKCFLVRIVLSFAETGEDKIFSARGARSIDFGYTTIKTPIIHKSSHLRFVFNTRTRAHTHTHTYTCKHSIDGRYTPCITAVSG